MNRIKYIFYLLISPLIYIYALLENQFNSYLSLKAFNYEFILEMNNVIRLIFGLKTKDNSIKVSNYNFKLKAKSSKIDIELAFNFLELFGKNNIYFNKKEKTLTYYHNSENNYKCINIKMISKNKYKFKGQFDYHYKGKNKYLNSEYLLSPDQIIEILKYFKGEL